MVKKRLHSVVAKRGARIELGNKGIFGYKFWRPGDETSVFALWSVSGKPTLVMQGISGGQVINMWGNPASCQPDKKGNLTLNLTGSPVYVEVPGRARRVKISVYGN